MQHEGFPIYQYVGCSEYRNENKKEVDCNGID